MIGKPDYSSSKKDIKVFSFYGPGCGKFISGLPMGDGTDFRIKERYQEYKDCGFDMLMLENDSPYNGEDWETCKTKEIMDICYEIGLRVIVYDDRLYRMAKFEFYGLYGKTFEGNYLPDQAAVNALVAEYMKDYANHPAFYGILLVDEPSPTNYPNVIQVSKGVKAYNKDAYIHVCLLPYECTSPAYLYLINQFQDIDDIGYDDYMWGSANHGESAMNRQYLAKLERAKKMSQDRGLKLATTTLQVFGGPGIVDHVSGCGFRSIGEREIRYQAYATLAFIPDKMCYYHYWPSMYVNAEEVKKSVCIMNEYGEKILYNEVQTVNREIKRLGKVMANFEVLGTNYYSTSPFPNHISTKNDFAQEDLKIEADETPVLVNTLFDKENACKAYYLFNCSDPLLKVDAAIILQIKDVTHLQIYDRQGTREVALEDGKMSVVIPTTEGILIIPYKINEKDKKEDIK